jgi:hypothetical protein
VFSTIETVKRVVLVTDCGLYIGRYAQVRNAVMISTKVATLSAINAEMGAVAGDLAKNYDLRRKAYIQTMSGFNMNSNFTASNVAQAIAASCQAQRPSSV